MKQRNASLKVNFIMNAILTLSSFLFPLVTFPYVSRILLPAGTGKVSFATSLVSYFAMMAQLGIPTYGIRACARVRDDRKELTQTTYELLCINMIMCIISYSLFFLVIGLVPRLREERLLYVIVSLTIAFNTLGMEWLYKALEEYTYIAVRSIFFKLIALIAMFLLVHEKGDYVIYGGISIFASSASSILNFIHARRYIDRKPIRTLQLKKHGKAVGVFFAMSCATTIYTNLDTVMLGFMSSDVDVGYYHAAVKIKTILVGIVTSLGTVLLPRASYYIQGGKMEEFQRIGRKALQFVFLAAAPLMVYFILFAREGIFFLSGTAYEGAILPMQVIMPTLLFIGITNIIGLQMLVPLGQEKMVLYSEAAGALVDLVINMVLIPIFSSTGAAIGTVFAEITVLLIQYRAARNYVPDFSIKLRKASILLALLFAGMGSVPVKVWEMGTFLTLLISAIIFFGVYGMTLFCLKEPFILELMSSFMKRWKRER